MYGTLDLNIANTYPEPYDINIDVNSEIRIMFNYDINTSSVQNNFIVLKDKDMMYIKGKSLYITTKEIRGGCCYC